MSVNLEASKQDHEIIFSRKTKNISHSLLHFNKRIVLQSPSQNDLGVIFYAWLIFEEHLRVVTGKINRNFATIMEIAKPFTKTGINNYIESLCDDTPKLLWHDFWRSL